MISYVQLDLTWPYNTNCVNFIDNGGSTEETMFIDKLHVHEDILIQVACF